MPKNRDMPVFSSGYRQTIIRIALLMAKGTPALVAIDGMTCTGKTTYAELLEDHFPVDVLHADDLPGATVNEKVASIQAAIARWARDGPHTKSVCIVEGCYALHPALRRYYDLRICMQCDEQVREQRLEDHIMAKNKNADSIQITRKYLNSLVVEGRILGADLVSIDPSVIHEARWLK